MKKIASILLCLLIIFSFSACKKEKYDPVKEKVLNQFEEGIQDYKTALECYKKNDERGKSEFLEKAYDKLAFLDDITHDGNLTSIEIDDIDYEFYYEHFYSDKLVEVYYSNPSLHGDPFYLTYDQIVEEWKITIDNMNKVLDEYKEQEDRENIK